MTSSLPGAADQNLKALPARASRTDRLRSSTAAVAFRVIPRLPTGAARLLAGGRSVTIDGNTLDPKLRLMLSGQLLVGIKGLSIGDEPVRSRALLHDMCLAFGGPQIHVAVRDTSIPGPGGDIPARHYRPARLEPAPMLVFYHGGGWVIGDLDAYDALCRLICRDAEIHVLSVDYRLAPEHPALAGLDDAFTAFRWAVEHATELGAIPGKVAVGGDSAGGNLAAVVSQLARNDGGPAPALQWLIYPRTDLTARTRSHTLFATGFLLTKHDIEWFEANLLAGSGIEPTDPRVSPLLADDLSGLPPALIAVAGFDPLRDEGEQYAMALRDAGNDVDFRSMRSLIHGFVNLFQLGGGSAAGTTELISALRAHLARV